MSFLSGLPAAVASKAVTGFAVATLAVAGAGAVTATAATGSPNPANWGKAVTAAVAACKNNLNGAHGIGSCVSAIAKLNGKQESAQHASSARSTHPTGPPAARP